MRAASDHQVVKDPDVVALAESRAELQPQEPVITCIDLMGSLRAQCENRAPTTSGKALCMVRLVRVHLFMVLNELRGSDHTLLTACRSAVPSSPIINQIPSLNS